MGCVLGDAGRIGAPTTISASPSTRALARSCSGSGDVHGLGDRAPVPALLAGAGAAAPDVLELAGAARPRDPLHERALGGARELVVSVPHARHRSLVEERLEPQL